MSMSISTKKLAAIAAVALLAITSCGRLSKSDAKKALHANYFDIDDNVYCTWKGSQVSTEGTDGTRKAYAFFDADKNAACIDELDAAGIVKKGTCLKDYSDGCWERAFSLGPNVDIDGLSVRFPCGKKKLGDVTSISTEGKSATVKFMRDVTRDSALTKDLGDCALDGPETGTEEQTMKFRKDDDGKWSTPSKATKPVAAPPPAPVASAAPPTCPKLDVCCSDATGPSPTAPKTVRFVCLAFKLEKPQTRTCDEQVGEILRLYADATNSTKVKPPAGCVP